MRKTHLIFECLAFFALRAFFEAANRRLSEAHSSWGGKGIVNRGGDKVAAEITRPLPPSACDDRKRRAELQEIIGHVFFAVHLDTQRTE